MHKNHRTRASVFGPLISVLAVILGLVLVGPISPAGATDNGNNDECVPSDAVDASFTNWAFNHWTDWSSSDAAPADTDGDGALDPSNLSQVGSREQTLVSNHDGYTETVTDHAAYDEIVPAVPGQWWNWSPNKDTEPFDGPPAFPSDDRGTWEGPHTEGGPDQDASGTYNASNENSGNSSWFHREQGTPEQTIHHAAVTHQVEHADTTHTEYRWSILTRTYTPAKAAVTCDQDPAGNNGTIKVDDDGLPGCSVGGSDNSKCDNGVGNDPQLHCQFYVEWYGYEDGATSTVSFETQQPTDPTVSVVTGDTTVTLSAPGQDGFNGSELYQLAFTDASKTQGNNQGWHVQVTTTTTWSNGPSEVKHKTFWVDDAGCGGNEDQSIPTTPAVTMHDDCGTANDSGPTYTTENEYWTASQGEGNTIVFHAKDGYVFPAGGNTSEDGKTYTVSYTPNTDVACTEVLPEDATASVSTLPASCAGAGSLVLGDDIANATWGEPTIENNTYSVVATAASGHLFAAGDGVSGDQTTETFTGSLQPAFTQQQIEDNNCVEVEGEQTGGGHSGHHSGHNPGHQNTPEVQGEQAHAAPAAAAVVPTEVEAGLAGTPARVPAGGSSNNLPLWALSLGAGMFLIGAGRLRRTSRTAR